jgi:hypothetical protein
MANKSWIGGTTNWDTAGNWSSSGEPANTGDSAYFGTFSTTAVAGSDQSGITLDYLEIPMTMLFTVGDNATPLKVGMTLARIGEPGGGTTDSAGCGRINLDLDTDAGTIYIKDSNQANDDAGKEVIRLKGNNSSTVINVTGNASVGIATNAVGDTATFGTINVTGQGATVNCGGGLTLTNFYQTNGMAVLRSAPATLVRVEGRGNLTTYGDYTLPALTIAGGTVTANHRKLTAGNEVTTLTLETGGVLDVSALSDTFAVGTIVVNGDCRIITNPALPSHFSWTTLTRNSGKIIIE